jgi:hypothetical protein
VTAAKLERSRSSFLLEQEGHSGLSCPITRVSNSFSQPLQRYSKIGIKTLIGVKHKPNGRQDPVVGMPSTEVLGFCPRPRKSLKEENRSHEPHLHGKGEVNLHGQLGPHMTQYEQIHAQHGNSC